MAKDRELRVLIATDVLSEGQNLQDCAIVVNYDLPWAIIRLIQRAGRVDRIGQGAEEILCHSFMPADGVERIINLRNRVRDRLRENAEVIGTDEEFFEDDRDDRPIINLYNEQAGILDGDLDGEIDLTSQAYQIWKNAITADPSLERAVTSLPDVAFSSRQHSGPGRYAGRNPGLPAHRRRQRRPGLHRARRPKHHRVSRRDPGRRAMPSQIRRHCRHDTWNTTPWWPPEWSTSRNRSATSAGNWAAGAAPDIESTTA